VNKNSRGLKVRGLQKTAMQPEYERGMDFTTRSWYFDQLELNPVLL
jgi:hypothetical protein